MPGILFTNTAIFEGSEETLRPGEVAVEGNRIVSVASPGERLPRAGREVINLCGATLMPGLINTHSHLTYNNGTSVAELTAMPVRRARSVDHAQCPAGASTWGSRQPSERLPQSPGWIS